MSLSDQHFMAMAIRLAEKGRYSSHPNPSVGCILVRQSEIVGQGYTQEAGRDHAEAAALSMAAGRAEGATAYISLEPCSFEGRTPSCARALIKAGVERVVVAVLDPDPRNAGKGLEMLRAAGIDTLLGVGEASARRQLQGHIKRLTEHRPFVRLKLAMTLDGKTALSNGESKWITGEAARADVQRYRAMSSAIITGVQTVIDDDPDLSVRAEQLDVPNKAAALRVHRPVYVLDSSGRMPPTAKLLARKGNVLVCHKASEVNVRGAEVLALPGAPGAIDLVALLTELASREHSEVLFECGATLAGSLLAQRLVDELVIYVAPRLMGGGARSLLNLPEIARMSGLVDLQIEDIRAVGNDFRITATLA
jgi:diaminohydroxyphosphoribosylaminopyrimidine deaminase/5-amino-6-(5-phosphoribosylamino)uracil reductase